MESIAAGWRDSGVPQTVILQMACEKLTKAHLCKAGSDPHVLQASHAYIAKTLPVIIRQQLALSNLQRKSVSWLVAYAKRLAQEIELLAPAVRRGGKRPDNCEYPWEDDAGRLHLPLDWSFPASALLLTPAGRTFLKLVGAAIRRLQ